MAWQRLAVVAGAVGLLAVGWPMARSTLRAQSTPDQLEQLVAPIALYPDELVAEVLAASTYPAQVDEAAHWLQQNASLSPDQVATAVDKMDWDDSVKALTEFPEVLAMMDQNLSWTSTLGDAYFNQPDDVLDAVQALRQRAIAAGTLQSTPQMTVSTAGGEITIEPVEPDAVSVPSYDCWDVYGAPISPFPEFAFGPGYVAGPHLRWGAVIRIGGAWGRVNWGWHNWTSDWSHRRVDFHRTAYVSRSQSVVDHHFPVKAAVVRGGAPVAPRVPSPPANGRADRSAGQPIVGKAVPAPKPPEPPKAAVDHRSDRGFPQANPKPTTPPSGTRSGAFGGFNHGGVATQNSSRGRASMGAPPASPPAGQGRGRGGRG